MKIKGARYKVFPPGGLREQLLGKLWPTTLSWWDILARLNEIPGERPVRRGTMSAQAQRLGVRRPGRGRYWREMLAVETARG